MTNYYVVIVGAGPSGLMAAKRGAEKELQVVVIERKKDVSHQNGDSIGIKFDKGRLLQGLKEECERLGVSFLMGTVAYTAQDTPDRVTVHRVLILY